MQALRRIVNFYRLQVDVLWSWRPGRRALIKRLLLSFVVALVSLWAAIAILPSLSAPGLRAIAQAVVILGLFNLVVRPIVIGALASVSVILIVVATLVLQIAGFYVAAALVPEFNVGGVISVFLASLIYATVNMALGAILAIDEDDSYWGVLVARLATQGKDVRRSDVPGVVIIQIDGLAQPILAHQIRAGRVPFISRWVRSGEMKLDGWTALLPSQTSASQAGILHGNNSFIPAFRWWEKPRGRMLVSNHPADALEIVERASNGEGLLSNDGASIGNLVSGDATRSYITMATIKDKRQGLGRSQTYFSFFASPTGWLHTLVLSIGEIVKEYFQARRAHRAGIEPIMHRGMPYPVARAATNVGLRHLATSLVLEEMYRGAPVIYVDFTDYDEIAHHSGPERGETLDALDGVDRTVRNLVRAAENTPRPYRFILLSDHGQSLGATFRQRYGVTLQDLIADWMNATSVAAATAPGDTWGPLNAAVSEAAATGGATGAITRAAFKSRTTDGAIDLTPAAEQQPPKAPAGELPELVVCASGNLAQIYFPRLPGRVTREAMDAHWPGLVDRLAAHPGIGLLMVRTEGGSVLLGPEGERRLDDDAPGEADPVAKYGAHAIEGLRRVDGMEHCGDLVAISLLDPATDEVAAFEELIGSHGGIGGPQTQAFLMHPAEWPLDEPLIGAEAVYRQIRRWLERNGLTLGRPAPEPTPEADAADRPAA